MNEPLKIVRLQAENFKRLVAIDITPDGDVVQLTGRNRQGKTSILDAIWAAIAGKAASPINPVRIGCEQASVRVDMGTIIVTRNYRVTEDGNYTTNVTVTNEKGVKFPGGAQGTLDQLYGALTFDPLEFSRMKPLDQVNVVKRLVPDFDFDAAEKDIKAYYDDRTAVNKEAERVAALMASMPVPAGLLGEPIDEEAIVQEMAGIGQRVSLIQQRKARRDESARDEHFQRERIAEHHSDIAHYLQQIKEIEAKITTAQQQIAERTERADKLRDMLANAEPLPELPSTVELQDKLAAAKRHNETVRQLRRREELAEELKAQRAKSTLLTASIKHVEDAKRTAVMNANLPVKGLELGESRLLLNELPFEQASGAETLRTSIAIAMALNPRLHVLRVKDASLLDDEQMAIIYDMARAADYQVWLEVVDTSGEVGIVIEDGRVKAVNADPLNIRDDDAPKKPRAKAGK